MLQSRQKQLGLSLPTACHSSAPHPLEPKRSTLAHPQVVVLVKLVRLCARVAQKALQGMGKHKAVEGGRSGGQACSKAQTSGMHKRTLP